MPKRLIDEPVTIGLSLFYSIVKVKNILHCVRAIFYTMICNRDGKIIFLIILFKVGGPRGRENYRAKFSQLFTWTRRYAV